MTEKFGGHLSRSFIILEEAQVIQVEEKQKVPISYESEI